MAIAIEQAELLAQVAHLYFNEGLDQNAIARRLKVSRSSISRLLAQARREGVVEIRIHYPLPTSEPLATALQERFGLQQALVLHTAELRADDILQRVCLLAAKYLDANLNNGDVLGISWGGTLHELVQNFHPSHSRAVDVVQLVGTLRSSDSEIDGANLARHMAEQLGGQFHNLAAPLIVENAETRRALLQEPAISEVLDLARRAAVVVVGIGGLSESSSAVVRLGLCTQEQLESIKRQQGVGDICAQYFDVSGCLIKGGINERVVGIDLRTLKDLPRVVGLAVGRQKACAILGALRGRLINVLVTDDVTAEHVLQADSK
jgi:deoxyribonucleoside regulator